jgi:hypothetical protein
MEIKLKLVEAIAKVSNEDFKLAADRWLAGFNAESMLDNFVSILEEYSN